MKRPLRILLSALILLAALVAFYNSKLRLQLVYRLAAVYAYTFAPPPVPQTPVPTPEEVNPAGSQVELVVSSIRNTNTSWLAEFFPHYPAHVYVSDDPLALLTVPINKGRESAVYLTYIIDNYDNLPDHVIFLHGGRYQWHNEDPLYDGVRVLERFRIPYVTANGFATLRCTWQTGCPVEMMPDPEIDAAAKLAEDSYDYRGKTEAAYAQAWAALFPGEPVPDAVGVHSGAQFAVTREAVRRRSRDDYRRYRAWLWDTDVPEMFSGRVLEYTWHIIFGQPAVACPHAATCFCEKFGLCDLTCVEHGCHKRYWFKFGELPENWPDEGTGQDDWPARDWAD